MTLYAYDETRGVLIATWDTGARSATGSIRIGEGGDVRPTPRASVAVLSDDFGGAGGLPARLVDD